VLSLGEREEISRGIAAGNTFRAIATNLKRAVCTVSQEVELGTVAGIAIGLLKPIGRLGSQHVARRLVCLPRTYGCSGSLWLN
jgi:hypothetical protein